MTNTSHLDAEAYENYITKQHKFLDKMCDACGIRFKQIDGTCRQCKEGY